MFFNIQSTEVAIEETSMAPSLSELRNNPKFKVFSNPFNPVANGLEPTFRLTKLVDLKGQGCKIPESVQTKFLEGFQEGETNVENELSGFLKFAVTKIGIGMDACIIPLHHHGLSLIQTTDFLYPVVDDPYMMGRIACASVISDLYAKGVTECDNMLMLLGVPIEITGKERKTILRLIMCGFKDSAKEAGTKVTGGQTVVNEWCTIGGVASSICTNDEYIIPNSAEVDDVLVLTKPLGTQVVLNAYQWLDQPAKWNKIKHVVSKEDVMDAYFYTMTLMTKLNKTAAQLMHKYHAHGATDVTGYGLLGHAQNLVKHQRNNVSFLITNLPVIAKMAAIEKATKNMFQLRKGCSVETSGGLLICLNKSVANEYCRHFYNQEGYQAWIVGAVLQGDHSCKVVDKPRIIEVPIYKKS